VGESKEIEDKPGVESVVVPESDEAVQAQQQVAPAKQDKPKDKPRKIPPLIRGMPETPARASVEPDADRNKRAIAPEAPGKQTGQPNAEPAAAATEAAESAKKQPVRTFRDKLSNGGRGPTMVEFAADRFEMGSGSTSQNFDERPRHEVSLKRFAISKNEVTFNQYDRFAKATGRSRPGDAGWGRGTRPVIKVAWQDAVAYTQWLSKQTGKHYRLPTEAEWEFAARSGSFKRYWWGNQVGKGKANCFDCGGEWAGRSTAPVGSFEASAYGVKDMAGNVREWVQDCYMANYKQAAADGSASESAGCGERVIRGGSYSSPSSKLRSAARDHSASDARVDDLGFRVVRQY
jgi:formylglycine-generating enzyme required for sulfatase activity